MELRDHAHRPDLAPASKGGCHLPADPHRPRRSEEAFEVAIFAPPSRLGVKGQIGPFNASSSYRLEPTADGTRLTNIVELEPSSALLQPIGPLAVPKIKAAIARNLGTLKQLLEGTRLTPEGDQP